MIERECLMMDKLDQIINNVHDINVSLAEIKIKLESTEKLLNEKISNHDKRIDKLENNQRWVAITIVGYFLLQVMNLFRGL